MRGQRPRRPPRRVSLPARPRSRNARLAASPPAGGGGIRPARPPIHTPRAMPTERMRAFRARSASVSERHPRADRGRASMAVRVDRREPLCECRGRRNRRADVDVDTPGAVGLTPPDGQVVAIARRRVRRVIDIRRWSGQPAKIAGRRDVAGARLPGELRLGERPRGRARRRSTADWGSGARATASAAKNSRKESRMPFSVAARANWRSVSTRRLRISARLGAGCVVDTIAATPRPIVQQFRHASTPKRVFYRARFRTLSRIGVPFEPERLAQLVGQEPLVGEMQLRRHVREQHERRRRRGRLRARTGSAPRADSCWSADWPR